MYKILLVDDEPLIREGLKHILPWEEYGIELVGEAENGQSALRFFEAENPALHPQLLVTDVKMPVMNGLQLIRTLRERGSKVRVILISGYDDFVYVKEALKYGVENYIVKPINREELSQTILEAIEKIIPEHEEEAARNSPPRQYIEEIMEYINRNYSGNLSLKTLAYKFNLSQAYLGQLIKKRTGQLFSDYLNGLRITKAKELLVGSMLKEKKISELIGYSDSNYFYRVFKKYVGVYPSEFRAEKSTGN
ncbi:MAG: response regulator [Clostridiales bacterium]|nr:response regulator [Clostridiales bacterium]